VKVKNTGARASDEVVQMYVQHLGSGVERPHIELKGFERVYIEPGAEKNVVFELRPRDLAYWDTARQAWRIEKEPVRILAGGSSDEAAGSGDSSGRGNWRLQTVVLCDPAQTRMHWDEAALHHLLDSSERR
jgi:hypothetical protein